MEDIGLKKFAIMGMVAVTGIFGLTCVSVNNSHDRKEQMKVCVEAGKTWVRSEQTAYYECK